jgi:hypothetical protein
VIELFPALQIIFHLVDELVQFVVVAHRLPKLACGGSYC